MATLYGSTWKGSATSVIDSSASKNHGTVVGNPIRAAACPTISFSTGQSALFNGVTSYLNLGDPASLEAHVGASGVCTITAWIKPITVATQMAIMGKYQNGGNDYQRAYIFMIRGGVDAGKLNFSCSTYSDSSNNLSVYSTNVLTEGIWSHVVAVYDNTQVGVLNKIKLYINGTLELGVNRSTGVFTSIPNTAILAAIGSLEGASANNPFNGNIDDVRYYNRALSGAEIATIASGALGAMDSALVGWWTLDSLGGVEINS